MNWYQNLYVSKNVEKKKKKLMSKIEKNAGLVDVYLITEASNGRDLFDIVSTASLKQGGIYRNIGKIYGMARGYQEAVDLVVQIVEEVYANTGDGNIKEYLNRKEGKKE